ncbi:MAG: ATP-binding protein [Opitutales bacterium]|nr:ATP-binding protein [Opitutales bacterium]
MNINRDRYLNQLINRKHNGLIKIVSGMRRCGKSYLLSELFKGHLKKNEVSAKQIISIDLEDFAQRHLRNPETCYDFVKSKIKDKKQHYLLIDEVQLMENFADVLNGFLHIKNLDVYVTGSNSKFLSTDVVSEFRGRGDEVRVYPLTFAEYYSAVKGDWQDAWNEYSTFGGLPYTLSLKSDEDKAKYLKNLFKETYVRDIVERNKVRNDSELEELLNIVASNIGALTNPKKLSDTFKSVKNISLTPPTVKQFIDYFQDSFLINQAVRYDIKGKKYIGSPLKYYFSDIGLRNAILNFRQQEETHIMENIVFNELLSRGYQIDVGIVEFLEKKSTCYVKKHTEVDFVVNNFNQRYYIQVASSIPTQEKKEQEERSLLKINDAFRKIVIVKDNIKTRIDDNGIITIGLKDFLLNGDILD